MTYYSSDARKAANMAGNVRGMCHQRHGGMGYFNHYHVGDHKNNAHMAFIVGG